ncbi:MAG TPA: helix-turn-helix domain-containing protein, partial [Ktedonobacteraceae bacterium]|nr:helix-turn-helix domain-containing protein [Ktedonobacteraceae bacterium]
MIRAHKIRLNPTEEQKNYFARAAGIARFVWNWALAEWDRQYQAGEKP